jgi:predicted amidohydrolase
MTTLRLAAVQTSPEFGAIRANTDRALDLVPADCDLAVLPELFSTGYQFRSREEASGLGESLDDPGAYALGRLRACARDTGAVLAAGLCERDGDAVYNSAVLVRPDGTCGLYRKVHLFLDEKDVFTPGDLGFPVFAACGTTVGIMVCFDWAFPEAARSLALAGAAVIAHPSNLVLPWCQQAMITRCLENRVAAVTANRVGTENRTGAELIFSGMSQVVSPRAQVLQRLGAEETGAAVGEIDLLETDKLLTPRNDLLADRRPDQYRA